MVKYILNFNIVATRALRRPLAESENNNNVRETRRVQTSGVALGIDESDDISYYSTWDAYRACHCYIIYIYGGTSLQSLHNIIIYMYVGTVKWIMCEINSRPTLLIMITYCSRTTAGDASLPPFKFQILESDARKRSSGELMSYNVITVGQWLSRGGLRGLQPLECSNV